MGVANCQAGISWIQHFSIQFALLPFFFFFFFFSAFKTVNGLVLRWMSEEEYVLRTERREGDFSEKLWGTARRILVQMSVNSVTLRLKLKSSLSPFSDPASPVCSLLFCFLRTRLLHQRLLPSLTAWFLKLIKDVIGFLTNSDSIVCHWFCIVNVSPVFKHQWDWQEVSHVRFYTLSCAWNTPVTPFKCSLPNSTSLNI